MTTEKKFFAADLVQRGETSALTIALLFDTTNPPQVVGLQCVFSCVYVDHMERTESLNNSVSLRVADSDLKRLEAVCVLAKPMSRASITRQALRLGLRILEEDIGMVIGDLAPGQKR